MIHRAGSWWVIGGEVGGKGDPPARGEGGPSTGGTGDWICFTWPMVIWIHMELILHEQPALHGQVTLYEKVTRQEELTLREEVNLHDGLTHNEELSLRGE